MYRIWSERTIPPAYRPLLKGATILGAGSETPDQPLARLAGADAIIAASRIRYDAAFLDQVQTLKVIARTGIGVDNIDINEATRRGIMVCNAPDGPSVSTAEHTIMLLLGIAKQVKRSGRELREGKTQDYFSQFTGIEVHGRRLGLVGLGRIGSRVAKIANTLGMTVVCYDPYISPSLARELNVDVMPSLDALLRTCDFVSLHIPCTPETRHVINRAALQRMKSGAYLINCARGGLVDEAALLEALESGHLRGAALDVFEQEPPPPDHPLLARDDVLATPHVAGATDASKAVLWQTAIRQVLQALHGERPQYLVNPETWALQY